MKTILTATVALLLTSCATAYKPAGFGGGFSSAQLDVNVFQVSFQGNGYTRQDRAADFALLRSAEVALENGYQYFAIVDRERYSKQAAWTTPSSSTTNLNATTYGNLSSYGNVGTYSGNTYGTATTTNYGGQTFLINFPNVTNTIVCFKERPEGFVYNAPFVVKSMKEKYGLE
jgi:hypothetical protein